MSLSHLVAVALAGTTEALLSTARALHVRLASSSPDAAVQGGILYAEAFGVASLTVPLARRVYQIDVLSLTGAQQPFILLSDAAALPADGVTPKLVVLQNDTGVGNANNTKVQPLGNWMGVGGIGLANGLSIYNSTTALTKTIGTNTHNYRVWYTT